MIKRLLTLVFFIVIGIVLSQYLDISASWQKAQAFLSAEPEGGILEKFLQKTKEGDLLHKKEYLEKKLEQLQRDLSEVESEGGRRFNNIEETILKTKHALLQAEQSLEHLRDSAEESVAVIGKFGEGEVSASVPTVSHV